MNKIQQALNKLDRAGLKEDGIYGPRTAAAVLAYKRARNIVNRKYQTQADNIVGRMTVAALDRELLGLSDPQVIIGTPTGPILSFAVVNPPVTPTAANVSAVIRGNPYVRSKASDVGLPPSVPPGHAYEVNVSVTPPLTGNDFIDLAVVNTSALNGIAIVAGPKQIQRSTTIAVLGSQQTEPGNAGKLQIQASLNGKVLATSNGFSVCAHPTSLTAAGKPFKDINDQTGVGMIVQETLESDSGASSHLDQVEWSELVEPIVRNNPPFGGGSGNINNSGYKAAIPPQGQIIGDRHVEPTPSAGPKGQVLKIQVHMFKCKRCGALDEAIPFSGFEITHEVFQAGREFKHQVTKKPAEVGIRIPNKTKTIKAKGGFGTVTSAVHKL